MHTATVNAYTCSYYCGSHAKPEEFHPGLTGSCCGEYGNYDCEGNVSSLVTYSFYYYNNQIIV